MNAPTGHRANFAFWRTRDSLTVWELAALMNGIDPRAHADGMIVGPDGNILDLSDQQDALIAGIRAGTIEYGQFEQPPPTSQTSIKTASAIEWLRQHNHAATAAELDRTLHNPAPDLVVKKDKLVERYEAKVWPTIVEDLKRAKKNGLNIAQAGSHGLWNEPMAVDWARKHGKLLGDLVTAPQNSPWPSSSL